MPFILTGLEAEVVWPWRQDYEGLEVAAAHWPSLLGELPGLVALVSSTVCRGHSTRDSLTHDDMAVQRVVIKGWRTPAVDQQGTLDDDLAVAEIVERQHRYGHHVVAESTMVIIDC